MIRLRVRRHQTPTRHRFLFSMRAAPLTGLAILLPTLGLATVLAGCTSVADRTEVVPDMPVVFENAHARVQWHDVEIGETVGMHAHPRSIIIVLSDSRVRFHFPDGTSREAEGQVGRVHWAESVSHAVENTGGTKVHNLVIEMKDPVPLPSGASDWPTDLLPQAAAPEQHTLLLENDAVTIYEVVSPPGGVAPAHVHAWPSLFITFAPARLVFRDAGGNVVAEVPGIQEGEPLPRVQWFEPSIAARSVENADSVELRAYRIEFKSEANDR